MSAQHFNQFGQPIGVLLPDWSPRPFPPRTPIAGRFCRVEPLDPDRHVADLFAAAKTPKEETGRICRTGRIRRLMTSANISRPQRSATTH